MLPHFFRFEWFYTTHEAKDVLRIYPQIYPMFIPYLPFVHPMCIPEMKWSHTRKLNLILVNHFPRFYELTRKNLLAKNLKRFQKMMVNRTKHESNDCREAIESEMNFFPVTFELPDQWHMFVEEFKVNQSPNPTQTSYILA